MGRRITLDPGQLVPARHDYENTSEPLATVARRHGMSRSTFAAFAKREGWSPRSPSRSAAEAGDPDTASFPDLSARIQRTVERELAAIDAILARLASEEETSPASERTARTLASLTRTLKEVQRLRAAEADGLKTGAPATDDEGALIDDDMPRDIDEFRRELARRIDAFVASRTDAGLCESKEP